MKQESQSQQAEYHGLKLTLNQEEECDKGIVIYIFIIYNYKLTHEALKEIQ